MSVTASNVGQNMGIVMPDVEDVRRGTTYAWQRNRTGALVDPNAPVITSVVDNGDGDSVTISVTGSDTITVYYQIKGSSVWVIGNSRSGDGDIIQGGLTASKWYVIQCVNDDGATSLPSNIVNVFLDTIPGTGTLKIALHAILSGDTGVTDIVGTRITPGGDPARGNSSVVFYQVSDNRPHTMSGPDDLVTPIFQVNSYDMSDLKAETLSDAVMNALDGFNGTVAGVSISYMALISQGDIDDFEPENKQASRQGIRQDYEITYTEP
jgi:hypothetical protein